MPAFLHRICNPVDSHQYFFDTQRNNVLSQPNVHLENFILASAVHQPETNLSKYRAALLVVRG